MDAPEFPVFLYPYVKELMIYGYALCIGCNDQSKPSNKTLTTGSMTVFCFIVKNLLEMQNKVKKCIPAITVRTGKVKKPVIRLGEVLNFIERANRRQSRIILYTMRQTAWYVPNQVDDAFGRIYCKERRVA